MSFSVDDVIEGKYRVVRVLGHGGVGAVYEAENLQIRRRVAIKVLHAQIAQQSSTGQRFRREAQAAARVGSDRIVEVLDFGTLPDGANYLVMEYLEGESLTDRVRKSGGVLPPATLLPIVADLLEGLEDAHEAGIIHRDLKPDNIFLCQPRRGQGDFVKILDFGISKFTRPGEEQTLMGVMMGTPYFMSPEQGLGSKDIDGRADIYSVGAILFRCLTGYHPFAAEALGDLLQQLLNVDAPRITDVIPGYDAALTDIVARALARDPRHRQADAGAMRAEIHAWLTARGLPLAAGTRDAIPAAASFPSLPRETMPSNPQLLVTPTEIAPDLLQPAPLQPAPPNPATLELAVHVHAPGLQPTPITASPVTSPPAPSFMLPIVIASACGLVIVGVAGWWLSRSPTTTTETSHERATPAARQPTAAPVPADSSESPTPSASASAEPAPQPSATTSVAAPPWPNRTAPPTTTKKRRTFRRKLR